MLGEITKELYIYTVTTTPDVFDYLENEATRSFVGGLMYRARRKKHERFFIRTREYDVEYDSEFHYHITQVIE